RYPETVEIDLLKSTPGSFTQVTSTTQSVPVMRKNATVDIKFTYIFTPDDAAQGKVTFKAVAKIIGFRDALPGDNEADASPTRGPAYRTAFSDRLGRGRVGGLFSNSRVLSGEPRRPLLKGSLSQRSRDYLDGLGSRPAALEVARSVSRAIAVPGIGGSP